MFRPHKFEYSSIVSTNVIYTFILSCSTTQMAADNISTDQETMFLQTDALAKEIVRCFDDCHSVLEKRKNHLLERVRQMKELYQKHRDIVKAIEQMKIVIKATNDALSENYLADYKNQVMSISDDKIKNLENEKLKLGEFCELKFVPNFVEFEQCVNTFHLNECGAMEFCKRREPCVMKRLGDDNLGRRLVGSGLAVDTDTDLLYVTGFINKHICIFSKDGELRKKFGKENLDSPYDLCLSKECLFVTDGSSIVKFSKSGEYLQSSKCSSHLTGICISLRSVYVCNYTRAKVEVFGFDLVHSNSLGRKMLELPRSVKIHESKIFVLTETDNSVHVFDSNDKYLYTIPLPGLESNLSLCYFTMDLYGNFIISDRGAHCLKIYNAKGEFIESIGVGYLISPRGIATDRNNRIIVVSESPNNLQLY